MWIQDSDKEKLIRYPKDIVIDGVQHPAQIFLAWSKQELSSIGIKPFHPATYDRGLRVVGSTLEEVDGEVYERLELEQIPQEAPAVPPSPGYDFLRKRAYPKTDDLIVALWEKVMEGRNGPAEELQAARLEVKNNFPKPDEKVLI